jgi:hypothetical protein
MMFNITGRLEGKITDFTVRQDQKIGKEQSTLVMQGRPQIYPPLFYFRRDCILAQVKVSR